ncbi:MAG: hypothetical protein ACTHZX_09305 [Microbacterium sp.]
MTLNTRSASRQATLRLSASQTLCSSEWTKTKTTKTTKTGNARVLDMDENALTVLASDNVARLGEHPKVVQGCSGRSTITTTMNVRSDVTPTMQRSTVTRK